jgi:hypothetical protein
MVRRHHEARPGPLDKHGAGVDHNPPSSIGTPPYSELLGPARPAPRDFDCAVETLPLSSDKGFYGGWLIPLAVILEHSCSNFRVTSYLVGSQICFNNWNLSSYLVL